MTTTEILALLAFVVVGALALYAATLWWRVWRDTQRRAGIRAQGDSERELRHADIRRSIAVLARAQLQQQISHTEAAIRISTLARGLLADDSERPLYRPFDALTAATAHIPILDAWRALPRADKDRFDHEREALEAEHTEGLDQAANRLLAHPAMAQALT